MSKSLQDQLLGAGLVDSKKAKKVAKDKRKEKNIQRRNKDTSLSESQEAILQQQAEKKARDRELNLKQQEEAKRKSIAAQILQLIAHYKVTSTSGDAEYNFTDGKTIKKLYVTPLIKEEIVRGKYCIARFKEGYEIIPKPVADKIRERDTDAILVYNEGTTAKTEHEKGSDEEYYAQFEIPDDLDW